MKIHQVQRVRGKRESESSYKKGTFLGNTAPVAGSDTRLPIEVYSHKTGGFGLSSVEASHVITVIRCLKRKMAPCDIFCVVVVVPVRWGNLYSYIYNSNIDLFMQKWIIVLGWMIPYPYSDFMGIRQRHSLVVVDDLIFSDCHWIDPDILGYAFGVPRLQIESDRLHPPQYQHNRSQNQHNISSSFHPHIHSSDPHHIPDL